VSAQPDGTRCEEGLAFAFLWLDEPNQGFFLGIDSDVMEPGLYYENTQPAHGYYAFNRQRLIDCCQGTFLGDFAQALAAWSASPVLSTLQQVLATWDTGFAHASLLEPEPTESDSSEPESSNPESTEHEPTEPGRPDTVPGTLPASFAVPVGSERLWNGRQSNHFEQVYAAPGGRRVRVRVSADSYEQQGYALLEGFDPAAMKWNTLFSLGTDERGSRYQYGRLNTGLRRDADTLLRMLPALFGQG